MEPRTLLDILPTAERLKDTPRHCSTPRGRHESVAERSWMAALKAFFHRDEMPALYAEMTAREPVEAKIYKAIDNLEAVFQHNLSDLSTWIPHEYQLNQTYGTDKAAFSPYLTALRQELKKDTLQKIENA